MARREWQNPSVLQRDGANGREWYCRYRVKVLQFEDGRPVLKRVEKWQHLGMCAKMTKRQAEREKDKVLREVNAQVYTVQSQIPFSAVLEEFRTLHVPSLAAPSRETYLQRIRCYIEPALGTLRLCDIGPREVEQLFAGMERAGLSRNTRQATKGVLKAVFSCAIRWKFCTENPVQGASIGGGARIARERRIPSTDDVLRLIDACDRDIGLLIETLVTTGMRISEACGLTVADLDFARGLISVTKRRCRGNVGDTKSEAGTRQLGMGSLAGNLQRHVAGRAPTDAVFTYRGNLILDNYVLAHYLSPIMAKLGLKFPGFGWHSFRRLHLTLMAQRGLSVFDLRQQAGHADVRTTQLYIADAVEARAKVVAIEPFLRRA